jgi:hypothetical protein
VPCPHYSRDNNDCLLLQEPLRDDEEGGSTPADEPLNWEWCLAQDKGYRKCPVFRRYLADLLP